jgi:D-xylose 1-dehydrogenase (NADP+, D-xylono-1,5-lactone-forming)
MSVQWGVLSTAHINAKFLAGVAQSDECDVLAVASRDANRAATYAREHGIERSYGSYDELLDDPDLEAVYISLPNSMHVGWTERALRKGKHVLCEKPLSRRTADVEAAFDVAESADRLLMEAFMWRHNPQTERLVELVQAGVIGRPTLVRAAFSFAIGAGDEANVRLSADLEGGALMDVGCYCVSAARLLAGEPDAVSGQQLIGGDGVDVAFAGSMRFASGMLAHFDAGIALADRDELEVVGDEASLFLDDPWHCREPGIELRRDGTVELIELEPADSYRLEAENLSAAIRGQAEPRLGRADAVGQARVIEALYAAASR